jgi:hypothetical protein
MPLGHEEHAEFTFSKGSVERAFLFCSRAPLGTDGRTFCVQLLRRHSAWTDNLAFVGGSIGVGNLREGSIAGATAELVVVHQSGPPAPQYNSRPHLMTVQLRTSGCARPSKARPESSVIPRTAPRLGRFEHDDSAFQTSDQSCKARPLIAHRVRTFLQRFAAQGEPSLGGQADYPKLLSDGSHRAADCDTHHGRGDQARTRL